MAIQLRRGAYADFDPQKMKPAEVAVVQEDDPTSHDGKAVYVAISPGDVKRIAVLDELQDAVYNQIDTAISTATQEAVTTATQAAAESAAAAEDAADRAEAAAASIDFGLDAEPTQGSTNAVSSGGVWSALQDIQIDADAVPTPNSTNAVQSGGTWNALNGKVSKPTTNPDGTAGQVLRTNGDGTTTWASVGLPTDEQTAEAVSDWLDAHPEATTTVQDGAITEAKFSNALKLVTIKDYVTPEMFGAVGDGVTDDTTAFRNAVNTGKLVYCSNKYKITEKIQLNIGVDGCGKIIFTGGGCFTVSVGTTVSNVSFETYGKLLDFVDTDVTSVRLPNAHMMVLFKDIKIYCKQGAGTLFDIKSETYGFFDMTFKSINITGICNKCINISSTGIPGSWITQIYFIDCMFGSPLHVITASKVDNIILERCTSQANNQSETNLLYDFSDCKRIYLINCFDWDYPYESTAKIYKLTNCAECVLIGNDRTIVNYDMTYKQLIDTFAVLQCGYGSQPQLYTKSSFLRNEIEIAREDFFQEPFIGTTIMPVHGTIDNEGGSAIRVTNGQVGYYGERSFEISANRYGQLKLRVRLADYQNKDPDNHPYSKWSQWYTFINDAELIQKLDIICDVISDVGISRKTASGEPLVITDAWNLDVFDATIIVNAEQSGSGVPSPDNVRTISSRTIVTITRNDGTAGSNEEIYTISLTSAGTVYSGVLNATTGKFISNGILVDLGTLVWLYDSQYNRFYTAGLMSSILHPANNNTVLDGLVCDSYQTKTDNNTASSENNYSIGVSTTGWIHIRDTRYTTVEDFTNAVSGVYMAYPTNIQNTYDLTPTTITLLKGNNTISADSGKITLTYAVDVKTLMQ